MEDAKCWPYTMKQAAGQNGNFPWLPAFDRSAERLFMFVWWVGGFFNLFIFFFSPRPPKDKAQMKEGKGLETHLSP